MASGTNTKRQRPYSGLVTFMLLWLLVFALYYPAMRAGFVADFTGWLDSIRHDDFWAYINRDNFRVHSLYQFTQFTTYIFYLVCGANAPMWHLVHVSLHALNVYLLYILCKRLLADAGIQQSQRIAISGAVLFCVSPYASEAVVWEPAFHFLQGLVLILLVLVCAQQYFRTQRIQYAWYAGIVYYCSTFSLEICYITPWLVLAMAVYYRVGLQCSREAYRKALLYFFVPMLVLFVLHLVSYRLYYGRWLSHISTQTVSHAPIDGLGKPAKHLFHLLAMGRFFPPQVRSSVYAFCDSTAGIVLFYAIAVLVVGIVVVRYRKFDARGKVAGLLLVWVLGLLAIITPLWFGDILLAAMDRYSYFADAFLMMLIALLVSYIRNRYIGIAVMVLYALVQIRFTIKLNRFWWKSEKVNHSLLHNFPPPAPDFTPSTTIVLLNIPQSMQGIPMIGRDPIGEYKLMHNLLLPEHKIDNPVYEAVSYNMITPTDGAHVQVVNDSIVKVTMNQWGTWWWQNSADGAGSYETPDYRVDMVDVGHWYNLVLKRPANQYMLLYQVGNEWKVVNWNRKNEEQW